MEQGEPDNRNAYADEGTSAHFLAAECLTHNIDPATHIGKRIDVDAEGKSTFLEADHGV